MRKYIISFNYKEIEFSAKVLVKRVNGLTIISATLMSCELEFLLGKATIVFIQKNKGYELLLMKKDRTCEVVTWKLTAEFRDKSTIIPLTGFSLS
jgi:hypothetical protein